MKNLVFVSLLCAISLGSTLGDAQHAYKTVSAVVLNASLEPVFGETVQTALTLYLKEQSRFEYDDALQGELAAWSQANRVLIGDFTEDELKPFIQSRLLPTVQGKVDAAVFAELIPPSRAVAGDHGLFLALVNAHTGEVIKTTVMKGLDSKQLESFTTAARKGAEELVKTIPFGATVVRREGYRVILDRGLPEIRKGMQVPAFTIDTSKDEPSFHETGTILITRSERNLAFGKVVADKRPDEIREMNKVWTGKTQPYAPPSAVALLEPDRGPASEGVSSFEAFLGRPQFGHFEFDFGASLVTLNNSNIDQTTNNTGNVIFPMALMRGEMRITRRWYAEFEGALGASSVQSGAASLGSRVTNLRFFGGYRISPFQRAELPSLYVKLGLMQHTYAIDPSEFPLQYASASYSGPSIGAGADFSFDARAEFGFYMNAILLPKLIETPLTSGTVTGANSWELGARGCYHLSPAMDAFARIYYQSSGAEFNLTGATRPIPLSSASQQVRGIYAGMAYRF